MSNATPSIRDQVAFYNAEWSKDARRYPNRWQLSRAIAILGAIAETGKERPAICELGAGTGWLTAILGAVGDAVGIELSDVAVETASQAFPHVSFQCADVLHWEHPRERYDIVVSHEVIEHVDDQRRYVEVADDLLKPGGRFIITTPNARSVAAMKPENRSHQPNEFILTKSQLRDLLKERFANVTVRSLILGGATLGIYRFVNAKRLHSELRRLGIYERFERAMLDANLGLHLLGVADKR